MIRRRVYNFLGMESTTVDGTSKLTPGKHTIHWEFAYDGGGWLNTETVKTRVGECTLKNGYSLTEAYCDPIEELTL